MFQSDDGKNLLFKDSTECLQEVPPTESYKEFLGETYMASMNSLRQCASSMSGRNVHNVLTVVTVIGTIASI